MASCVPKKTVDVLVKPLPLITIDVPPITNPDVGKIEDTIGVENHAENCDALIIGYPIAPPGK